jgi:hypothetical protein
LGDGAIEKQRVEVRQFVYAAKDALPGERRRNPSLEFGAANRECGSIRGTPTPGVFVKERAND